MVALQCLAIGGQLGDLLHRVERDVREAEDRGDVYSAGLVRSGWGNLAWLMRDDVAGARDMLALSTESWSQGRSPMTGWSDAIASMHIGLYAGDPDEAIAALDRVWSWVRRWGILRGS